DTSTAAVSLISLFGVADIDEVTGPGTAITTRPRSLAHETVFLAPERAAASTITTPAPSAAISRLRARKLALTGCVPGGTSDTTAPLSTIAFMSVVLATG